MSLFQNQIFNVKYEKPTYDNNHYISDFEIFENICMWINISIYMERKGYMVLYTPSSQEEGVYALIYPLLSTGYMLLYTPSSQKFKNRILSREILTVKSFLKIYRFAWMTFSL